MVDVALTDGRSETCAISRGVAAARLAGGAHRSDIFLGWER
jgi:hypothetical protein